MIGIPFHPKYTENSQRSHGKDEQGRGCMPCAVCGRAIITETALWWVHIHNGGISFVTDAEAKEMGEGGDVGFYPLGSDCYRRHPELKPYAYPRAGF